jgi:peptide/nickel transport system permease protein
MRLCDMVMSFPLFVLAMGIVAALGNSVFNIILATAIVNLPFYIRVARTEVNVRREAGFIEAARLSGNSDWRILFHHLIPNALPPMMVQVSLNMGWAILNAAGLSFIGLGVSPPEAEWGILVAEGATYIISGEWWVALFPGAVLMLAVFTFNLLGDGLRDLIDPRRRT